LWERIIESMTKNRSKLRSGIVSVLLGLIFSLLILEAGLRLGGWFFFQLQEHRNKLSIRREGTYRILCLGDSMTAVGGETSYPRQLEKVLNQRSNAAEFSVINKGAPGVDSGFIMRHLEDNLNKYAPDMVIVMMGCTDTGAILPYGDIPVDQKIPLKTFKLARILWNRLIKNRREEKSLSPVEYDRPPGDDLPSAPPPPDSVDVAPEMVEEPQPKYRKYVELGMFYLDREEFEKAEEILNKAIEINQINDAACAILTRYYKERGEYDKVEAVYNKAIRLNPKNDRNYIHLGWIYRDQDKTDQALEMFKKAIEVNPENGGAYASLSYCYEERGEKKLAEEYSRKAKRLRPEYYNPLTRRHYQELKETVIRKGIKLVCVQYPMLNLQPLKDILKPYQDIIFVGNERLFKEAILRGRCDEFFADMFAGNYGHCTPKGNRLLAENIADSILRQYFKESSPAPAPPAE